MSYILRYHNFLLKLNNYCTFSASSRYILTFEVGMALGKLIVIRYNVSKKTTVNHLFFCLDLMDRELAGVFYYINYFPMHNQILMYLPADTFLHAQIVSLRFSNQNQTLIQQK